MPMPKPQLNVNIIDDDEIYVAVSFVGYSFFSSFFFSLLYWLVGCRAPKQKCELKKKRRKKQLLFSGIQSSFLSSNKHVNWKLVWRIAKDEHWTNTYCNKQQVTTNQPTNQSANQKQKKEKMPFTPTKRMEKQRWIEMALQIIVNCCKLLSIKMILSVSYKIWIDVRQMVWMLICSSFVFPYIRNVPQVGTYTHGSFYSNWCHGSAILMKFHYALHSTQVIYELK